MRISPQAADAQLLRGCVADREPRAISLQRLEIAASSTFLLLQFSSRSCNEARGWDFVSCAELLQANSRVLSKLLMNLGLSKGVKHEAKWLEHGVTSASAREQRFLAERRKGTKRQLHPMQSYSGSLSFWVEVAHGLLLGAATVIQVGIWLPDLTPALRKSWMKCNGPWYSKKQTRCSQGPFWPWTLLICEKITAASLMTHDQFKPLFWLAVKRFLQERCVLLCHVWSICSVYTWVEPLPADLATVLVISSRKSNHAG